jgi:hypothetical protein
MSPTEAWLIASSLWLVACGGLARFVMARTMRWLLLTGIALAALALLGGAWFQDCRQQQQDKATPLLIVKEDVLLRRGNSRDYPARLEPRLPRGVEIRELSRRGGWVQVRLASGAIGWIPETVVLKVQSDHASRD